MPAHASPKLQSKKDIIMKISSAFPSDYLKAADLQGRAVQVIMRCVEMREIGGEPKPILYFEGKDRGMVVNKTNANKIAEMFGDDTDNWAGEEIVLFEAMVEFQGKTVAAIRVRLAPRKGNGNKQPRQPSPAPPPQDDSFADDIPF
jgi:arabinogalactan endo-1,4-beta-galactosidase